MASLSRRAGIILILAVVLVGFWSIEARLSLLKTSTPGCESTSLELPEIHTYTTPKRLHDFLRAASSGNLTESVSIDLLNYTTVSVAHAQPSQNVTSAYSEKLEVSLHGKPGSTVQLTLDGMPKGSYYKWMDDQTIRLNSTGYNQAQLLLYGTVVTPSLSGGRTLEVVATEGGSSVAVDLPASTSDGTVYTLSKGSVLNLPPFYVSSCASNYEVYGVVYAPGSTTAAPERLSLSVEGVYVGSKVTPLPKWVLVEFTPPSITLTPYTMEFIELSESNTYYSSQSSYISTVILGVNETLDNISATLPMNISIIPEAG